MIDCFLVQTRHDYCNSLIYDTSYIREILVQNNSVQLLVQNNPCEGCVPFYQLKRLNWLVACVRSNYLQDWCIVLRALPTNQAVTFLSSLLFVALHVICVQMSIHF